MSGFQGMDTGAVEALAGRDAQAAERLEQLLSALAASVDSVDWAGPDAEAFREDFRTLVATPGTRAVQRLHACGRDLRDQVEEQERASQAGGDEGSGGGSDDAESGGLLDGLEGLAGSAMDIGSGIGHGLADGVGDMVSPVLDRISATAPAVSQLIGDGAHLAEELKDVVDGGRMPPLSELASSLALPVASAVGVGWNAATGEDHQFFSDRGAARVSGDDVQVQDGGAAPHSVAALLDDVSGNYSSEGEETGKVQVKTVVDPDGHERYIVTVPGTEADIGDPSMGWGGQGNSRDWSANVRAMAGQDTAAMQNVRDAMIAAGVEPGADVMMVGHSQGGIINAALASDPSFNGPGGYNVTTLVSEGSPVESFDLPPGTQSLNIAHGGGLSTGVSSGPGGVPVPDGIGVSGDPVPTLDMGGLRADGSGPGSNHQEVVLPGSRDWIVPPSSGAAGGGPSGFDAVFSDHDQNQYTADAYAETKQHRDGALARFEKSPDVQRYLDPRNDVRRTTVVDVGR
ncbi:WXG100 family type VII secretion target [Brachybacterium sp. MASK1Z-5]|uniref:WXG100 family type VII secretion target n=1 Tax=Brachybacterium halotolerans TaxID=2795215 RepID=A0ABS1BBZ1_9MICO|nr:WXG100 family type VII secretion target [Brachybacterium halotolerans]MBK0332114.1 WXG100 family type VII secretion target [Brachybacterium halotolerans]